MDTPVATLDQVLDSAMQLSSDDQEMLLEIVRRRLVEERRSRMAQDAHESIRLYRAGELVPSSAEDIIRVLNEDIDEYG